MTTFLDTDHRIVFDIKYVKKNLYPLLFKIATSNKLKSQEDRKAALDKVIEIFEFENQQELIDLYHSDYTE
jgi:hypothetical protein